MFTYIIIILFFLSIIGNILFFTREKKIRQQLSSFEPEIQKLKLENEELKKQSEHYQALSKSILEKTYENIPRYVSIKRDLAISNLNINEVASSLRVSNDELVTHFSGILSNIDTMVNDVLLVTDKAEGELLSFVSDGNKDKQFRINTNEHGNLENQEFIEYIQKKYNDLLQKIIDELVMTHQRKLEDINTLDNIYKKVQGIITFSEEISEIAGGIELISLNANIEAAHAGSAGRGFVIVANEIRRLANLSEGAANRVKKEIKSTNKFIEDSILTIKEAMDAESQYLNSTIAIIQDVFIAMTKTLFQLIFQLTITLMNSMGKTSNIKNEIDAAINAMQFDKFIVQLNDIVKDAIINAAKEVDGLSEESMNNLEKINLFTSETLAQFKEQLANIETETQTNFQKNSDSKQGEDDITFF